MAGKSRRKDNPATNPSRKPGQSLRERILELVASQALDKIEISKRLNLPPSARRKLRDLLGEMETAGQIARVRKDRYVVPRDADLFTGTIQFHASGAAHINGFIVQGQDLSGIVSGLPARRKDVDSRPRPRLLLPDRAIPAIRLRHCSNPQNHRHGHRR